MATYIEPYIGMTPSLHLIHYYQEDAYNHIIFKYQGNLHRTDGPALIKWNYRKTTRLYYVNCVRISDDTFHEVYQAPIEDLPLYLNTYRKDIAIDRLKGERASILIHKTPETLIKDICSASCIEPNRCRTQFILRDPALYNLKKGKVLSNWERDKTLT